jgi:hypothetical protein
MDMEVGQERRFSEPQSETPLHAHGLELPLDDMEAIGPDYDVPTCGQTYCGSQYNA